MADSQTFEEFVTTRSPAFLRLAYALTRDHAHAEDLLQTTLARTWPAWKRIAGDPEPYVRRVLVNTHISWWRRRWNGERATGELPEGATGHPQSTVDDRDEVWRALERLPKRQRAVLVLRYFEDLSEAQIAETLRMAPGTVKSYAAKGLAQLRNDPSLLTVPPAPDGVERLTAVKERIKQRRRARAVTIVAAIVALVLILLGSSPILRRQSLEPAIPDGVPQYMDGRQIVAGKRVSFDRIRSGTYFTWTPGTLTPTVYFMCRHEESRPGPSIGIEVNGQPLGGDGCASGGAMEGWSRLTLGEEAWRDAGLELGVPVQAKIIFLPPGEAIPRDGMATVVVGEDVPWESYPLPTPPEQLRPVGLPPSGKYLVLKPDGAHRVVIDWDRHYDIHASSQTPGRLHIHVNGVLMLTLSWWDYEAGFETATVSWDMLGQPPAGQTTTELTVTPEDMTGDWIVGISPPG